MHEWSLLIFTVAVPAVVGGVLFLWYFSQLVEKNTGTATLKMPLVMLAVVSLIGLAGSFFHLGSPMAAIHTIRGFGRSWMSNEIVFVGAFIGLICLLALLAVLSKEVKPIFLLITGLIGLMAIFSMAQTYAFTRVNGWDHFNTYAVFFGTAFALGPVLGAGLLIPSLKAEQRRKIVKIAFAVGIFGIGIQIIGSAMFAAYTPEVQLISGGTAAAKLAPYSTMIGIRWFIELAGLAVLGYLSLSSKPKLNYSFLYAALAVLVVAEGMSRYVFYVLGA
ncbi:DmsC/YnfH family molybdoenzyme membrane anchor subunit [Bacillus sp. B15-48]|uniref:dimethyl sulfoxide reductase anchor subunit family protein n=1 Tax=Bacillus sp. B15-48 TaxID=1548601 RepID=UPI00193FFC34|nr:DmsC/YnfH family molybdoenzyme membrane anchor subunit [Bacillus sp. B15-48]MBM4761284.1 cyclic nucleotide-binding protein [Bacillus sp. B15-48]